MAKYTTKAQDIERWSESGFYDMADMAIKRNLGSSKYSLEMTKWLYEQKNGKAVSGVELSGSVGLSLTDLAKQALEYDKNTTNVS